MIKSNPFVNVRNCIKMHEEYSVKMGLNMLFYRKIAVPILSKACVKFGDLRAFFKLRNFSTVDIQGYSQESFALLEIVHYVCSPFPQI